MPARTCATASAFPVSSSRRNKLSFRGPVLFFGPRSGFRTSVESTGILKPENLLSKALRTSFSETASLIFCYDSSSMPSPWLIAHRGASAYAPENTLAAFRRAVELGVGFIETDLQLSRDAALVAIHDSDLNRTTSGRGPVHDFTLAELRQLDVGSWFAPEFSAERILTLEDILAFIRRHDVTFYLELKPTADWGLEHVLAAALRKANEFSRVVVISFDHRVLAAAHRLDNLIMTGLLTDDGAVSPEDAAALAVRIGARQLLPRANLVSPEYVAAARRADLSLVTWTINDPAKMRALASLGVSGIMSDYPDRLLSAFSPPAAS